MLSDGTSLNEVLAGYMPMPGDDWAGIDEYGALTETQYAVTITPAEGSAVRVFYGRDSAAEGEVNEPVTCNIGIVNGRFYFSAGNVGAVESSEQLISVTVQPPPVVGLESITISPAIGDSASQLSDLFQNGNIEYEAGGNNTHEITLSAPPGQGVYYSFIAKPTASGWAKIVAGDYSNQGYDAGVTAKRDGVDGTSIPSTVTITASADRAVTQEVVTVLIHIPTA